MRLNLVEAMCPEQDVAQHEDAPRIAQHVQRARDGFEAVTRAVSDGRYVVDRSLVRGDLGRLREDFVFVVTVEGRTATLLLRDSFVTDEFVDLARAENRTEAQEQRLDALKAQLAQRVMATPAADVYDAG